jgi:hypothetical protein
MDWCVDSLDFMAAASAPEPRLGGSAQLLTAARTTTSTRVGKYRTAQTRAKNHNPGVWKTGPRF